MAEAFGSGPAVAPKGKRFAAAIIDLIFMPIILGFIIGFLLLAVPEMARNIILVFANGLWLVFRDAVFAPGRKLVELKLVSLTGDKVTWIQALTRNVLLIIPFVLLVGYIAELVGLITKGERFEDAWAKTRVVVA